MIEMTFVLGLLPIIGTFAVSVPVSVYPLVISRPGATVIPFAFDSLGSVSAIFLRPATIHRSMAPDLAVIAGGIVEETHCSGRWAWSFAPSSSAEPRTAS